MLSPNSQHSGFLSSWPLLLAVMVLLTAAVYGNTFLNEWTYDDFPVVVDNPDTKSLAGFLKNTYQGRPLRELTYLLDYKIFGEEVWGYRIQQILWHALNGFLLFWIFGKLGLGKSLAFWSALLFLFHPIQVESVASIGHRKELLALFFALSAFLFYCQSVDSGKSKKFLFLACCCLFFFLAILANQTVFTIVFLFFLYDYIFLTKQQRILLKNKIFGISFAILLFVLPVVYYIIRIDFSANLQRIYSTNAFFGSDTYWPLFFSIFKVFLLYFGKVFFPFGLAPEYVVQISLFGLQIFLGIALVFLLVAAFFFFRNRNKLISFGSAWILLLFLPVSNFLPSAYLMADRYMYLILPGFCLVVAGAIRHFSNRSVILWLVPVLALLALLTVKQNTYWKDTFSLWSHAAAVNPLSHSANFSLGEAAFNKGEYLLASRHYEKAIEINRFFVASYFGLARSEEALGHYERAYENYKKYLRFGKMTNARHVRLVENYLPLFEKRHLRPR